MDRATFDRILIEEGIDEAVVRDNVWKSRPAGDLDENVLRQKAKAFIAKGRLSEFKRRKAN